jgi:hypothetical protein
MYFGYKEWVDKDITIYKLGVHHSRVRVLIRQGRLKAYKIGCTWVILDKDFKKLKIAK